MEKRKYAQWSHESLNEAIQAYRNHVYGFNECCRRFQIPKPTLKRHLDGVVKRPITSKKRNGNMPVLPENVEDQLVAHILKLEECFFGIGINDVRRLAYQIAEKNKIPNNFNKTTQLAGKKWFYSFMKRHPEISVRQPENTSMARAKGFNREAVYKFFDILEGIVRENEIDASRIFNVDESGFSTVQKRSGKILGQKGKKRVGRVVSGERGTNTTVVCCASASGIFVPPMIIYKRMRMAPALGNEAPPGSLIEVAEHGFIVSDLFLKWLRHFIDFTKPIQSKKILLLLDGHTTHSKNLPALELAKEHGVILLQLPAHTTHRLQPLDVGVFGPMQVFYDQAVDQWMTCHPGQCVTQFDVASIITTAYNRAASIANAASGFRATGCWPVDRFIFNDADFAASNNLNKNAEEPVPEEEEVHQEQATTSKQGSLIEATANSNASLDISIEDLAPIPTPSSSSKGKRKRKAQEAIVLTSSPYKNEVKEKQNSKSAVAKVAKVTKKLQVNSTPKQQNLKPVSNIEISICEEEWFCFICQKTHIEDMIQCVKCLQWVHEICAKCSKKDYSYNCPKCA